jgi:hypothetical protein
MAGFVNQDGSGLVGGLTPTGSGLALQMDASGNLKTTATMGASAITPLITQDQIRTWIANGQGFTGTTGKQNAAAAAATFGLSVFNPVGSGKTVLLFSLKVLFAGSNTTHVVTLTTSDPALGNAGVVTNNKAGNATTSVASTTFATANQTIAGTTHDYVQTAQNGTLEVFTNGDVVLLMPGNGLTFWMNITTAGGNWGVTASWVEF